MTKKKPAKKCKCCGGYSTRKFPVTHGLCTVCKANQCYLTPTTKKEQPR